MAALAVFAFAILLWGGYGRHWGWTGINGSTATLWDWLHLLLLPAAFGALPVVLSRRGHLRKRHKLASATLVGVFAAMVVAGYAIPWGWTGFTGNKLWDWLELIALPLAIALSPMLDDIRAGWTPRHSLLLLTALVALVVTIIGGYLGSWAWTGFRGNTLWDWLHLLLLPLLLPAFIVPRLKPMVAAGLTPAPRTPPDDGHS